MNLKKLLKTWYEQFISLHGEPRAIATGLAIGVFIGVTPTIPFHTIITIFICFLFKKNITAAYLGSWIISNPLTIPFFYFAQRRLGNYLLGYNYNGLTSYDYSIAGITHMGLDIAMPLLTGGFIMAPLFAVPAYFIAYRLITSVRKMRHDHSKKNH